MNLLFLYKNSLLEKFSYYIFKLTLRRPIGKVTLRRLICRAWKFRWRHCLRLSKFFTNVFAGPGAENHKLTLSSKIYLKNHQKLSNFISIFSKIIVFELLWLDSQTYFQKKKKIIFQEKYFFRRFWITSK